MNVEHGQYVPVDPNITHFSTGHQRQSIEVHKGFLVVNDPQHGGFVIGENGNSFYYDYFMTQDATRADGVSQLSKTPSHATIPNTGDFTRRWHTVAVFPIVEHFSRMQGASEEQKIAYTLKATGDDRAHTPFSHAVETEMEGWSGAENRHERMWAEMGALGGTKDVLLRHNIRHDNNLLIPGVAIPRWVECSAPDVNVDRLQYTVAELLLWFDHDQSPPELREAVRSICSLDNLTLTEEGDFAFKDIEAARLFAKGYLLLTTEHWNDPINRVQLHLLIEATKRAITRRRIDWMDEVDKGVTRHPDGYLLGVDQDIIDAMQTGPGNSDDFMFAVRNLLNSIAVQERERFINYKLREYGNFLLDTSAHDYPSELLQPKRVDFGPPSSQVSIEVEQGREDDGTGSKIPLFDEREEGVCYQLHPLKNRSVDPLVIGVNGLPVRLSEVDENYANLLREQQQVRKSSIIVRLALTQSFEEAVKRGIRENKEEFRELLNGTAPEMTRDQRRNVIRISAARAQQAAIESGRLILKNGMSNS